MKLQKEQHEKFNIFFEKPTRDGLREIISNSIGETDYLDFKAEWPELVKVSKHILAFANSGGGAMVVGVKQNSNGEFNSVGLSECKDKVDIKKITQKYVPPEVDYEIFDFSFSESEYPTLKGRRFQVLLVEYLNKLLPLLSLKEGKGIKGNVAYIREGTETIEANHSKFQDLINKRIDSKYSSSHLKVSQDLEQLRRLYDYVWSEDEMFTYGDIKVFPEHFGHVEAERAQAEYKYQEFISDIITQKENVIKDKLGLFNKVNT